MTGRERSLWNSECMNYIITRLGKEYQTKTLQYRIYIRLYKDINNIPLIRKINSI